MNEDAPIAEFLPPIAIVTPAQLARRYMQAAATAARNPATQDLAPLLREYAREAAKESR